MAAGADAGGIEQILQGSDALAGARRLRELSAKTTNELFD